LDIEDSWILRYLRSRFFTFLFFMPKILGNSSGKNNKVVGFFTTNPTKLSLHFSESSTIFYVFYKIRPKVKHYLRIKFHRGPWNFLAFTDIPSTLTIRPLQVLQSHHWGPRRRRSSPPARRQPDLAGVRSRVQGMLTLERLEGSAGAVTTPASLPGGARWQRLKDRYGEPERGE
jgi:hypothetical protein